MYVINICNIELFEFWESKNDVVSGKCYTYVQMNKK